jgi:hypothetical protein
MRRTANHIKWVLWVLFLLTAETEVSAHVIIVDPPDPLKIIYVDADADGSNVGTSWEHAVNSLQDALLLAYFPISLLNTRCSEFCADSGLYYAADERLRFS